MYLQSSSTPLCHVFMWKNLTRILLCFFFIINTDHSLLCSDRNNHRGSVVHARKWIAWMTSSCTLVAMTRSMSPGGWLYMLNLSLSITDWHSVCRIYQIIWSALIPSFISINENLKKEDPFYMKQLESEKTSHTLSIGNLIHASTRNTLHVFPYTYEIIE